MLLLTSVLPLSFNLCTTRSRKNEIGDEILDMLQSFTDFLTFKETMLDYKAVSVSWELPLV